MQAEPATDDESESEMPTNASSLRTTADDLDYSTSAVLNTESLMARKMEQFDSLLEENCLEYHEFGNAQMMWVNMRW